MRSVFVRLPIEYLHHDDKINPRPTGNSIRGLVEEFHRKRPQLHIRLHGSIPVKMATPRYASSMANIKRRHKSSWIRPGCRCEFLSIRIQTCSSLRTRTRGPTCDRSPLTSRLSASWVPAFWPIASLSEGQGKRCCSRAILRKRPRGPLPR